MTLCHNIQTLINQILQEELNGYALEIEPVDQPAQDSHTYIARPPDAHVVIKLHQELRVAGLYRKEAWCIHQAQTVGIPGPDALGVGTTDSAAYLIQRRLDGVNGVRYPGDRAELWRQIGRYAQAINRIPVQGYGEELVDPARSHFGHSWQEWMGWQLWYLFDDDFFLRHGLVTPHQIQTAQERLELLREWQFDPVLCHGNLEPKNVIVGRDGVARVIDWGTACAHRKPHRDLSEAMVWCNDLGAIGAFCESYGLTTSEREELQSDLDLLILLRLLDGIN